MFVPFISKRSESKLFRRKGGGGGGKGGGGGGKSGGSGGKSTGSSSSSSGSSRSGSSGSGGTARTSPISSGGSSRSATSYGNGGGKVATIPSGQPFAGRQEGGGTRNEVVGTRQYGSGYPGAPITNRGVTGLGFPFFFWPVIWGGTAGIATSSYLHSSEYGRPDNSSRPGGVLMTAEFTSSSPSTTFRILSDNTTIQDLITDITTNCSSANLNSPGSIVAIPYNDSSTAPKPEQVVQYYRASSVALSLDGYNDTAALDAPGEPDTPLPTNIDTTLLDCLNQTIAAAVPLVSGAGAMWTPPPTAGLIGVVYLLWSLSSLV